MIPFLETVKILYIYFYYLNTKILISASCEFWAGFEQE